MNISATKVTFDEHSMWVDLSDGRTIGVPFAWFPRLLNAKPSQREKVEIGRRGLHWDEIDEDISIAGLLAGRRDQTVNVARAKEVVDDRVARVSRVGGRRTGVNEDRLFVERRPEGDYAVRRPNSERASAVLPTQAEAIARARELNPHSKPLVERVRQTSGGHPDKWRRT
jgi:Protein of unknown function (DUF2442)/Uncharacterized protein conserved in bacteria (DUF2188)